MGLKKPFTMKRLPDTKTEEKQPRARPRLRLYFAVVARRGASQVTRPYLRPFEHVLPLDEGVGFYGLRSRFALRASFYPPAHDDLLFVCLDLAKD